MSPHDPAGPREEASARPGVDHRGHVLRIALELGQLGAIVATAVAFAQTGVSVYSCAALAAACALTWALARTPRPPLPGDSP